MGEVHEPRWLRVIALLPVFAVASFGAVGLLLADVGIYGPLAALLLGTAVFAGFCACAGPLWRRDAEEPGPTSNRCGLAAVACSIAYATWNGANASQHVQINRDGGLYLNAGRWIATHGNLSVHPFVGAFSTTSAVTQTSNGLSRAGRQLEFSLSHMLPALLAEAQNLGGDHLMFLTAPILSGVALLAFYVLGLRTVRNPPAALGATVCLALMMPQVSFSRDTTSEIPTQVLVFTALWLLCGSDTWHTRRTALCAGLLLGLVQPMHIDGLAYMLGLPIVFATMWFEGRRGDRRISHSGILWMALGVVVGVSLGFLDLALRDRGYLSSVRSDVEALAVAVALLIVVTGVVLVCARRFHGVTTAERLRRPAALGAGAVTLLAGFGAWLVRPLVQHSRGKGNGTVAFVQSLEHVPIDSTRRYSELSMRWISWYLGPLTLTVAILAAAVVACALVKGSTRLSTRIAVFMLAPPALLYLWRPSITPDNIWATRRFLPAVFPAVILLVFGAIGVITRASAPSSAKVRRNVAVVLGVCAIAYPAVTILGVSRMTEQRGEYPAVESACKIIGRNGAAVMLQGSGSFLYANDTQTLRSFCDVPVAVMPGKPNAAALRTLAREWRADGRRLFVVAEFSKTITQVFPGIEVHETLVGTNTHLLNFTLLERPSRYTRESLQFAASPVPLAKEDR